MNSTVGGQVPMKQIKKTPAQTWIPITRKIPETFEGWCNNHIKCLRIQRYTKVQGKKNSF